MIMKELDEREKSANLQAAALHVQEWPLPGCKKEHGNSLFVFLMQNIQSIKVR